MFTGHNVSGIKDLLPQDEQKQLRAKKFKGYKRAIYTSIPFGIRIGKARYYLFVAIDRASRYAYMEVHDNKKSVTAAKFLENVLQQYPFKIEKILTDNGVEFCYNVLAEQLKTEGQNTSVCKIVPEKRI